MGSGLTLQRQKISESILQLVERLSPTARSLNCIEELQYINHIITNGSGAQRQLNIFKETQSLRDVVNAFIEEFEMNTAMISTEKSHRF